MLPLTFSNNTIFTVSRVKNVYFQLYEGAFGTISLDMASTMKYVYF